MNSNPDDYVKWLKARESIEAKARAATGHNKPDELDRKLKQTRQSALDEIGKQGSDNKPDPSAPAEIWLHNVERDGHRTWMESSGTDSDDVHYRRVSPVSRDTADKMMTEFQAYWDRHPEEKERAAAHPVTEVEECVAEIYNTRWQSAPVSPVEQNADEVKREKERIRSAAIRKDGVVYPCWAHTYHEIKRMNLDAPDDVFKGAEQGFITSLGRYVDRGEAFVIAQREGQIIHKHGGSAPRLYSEDTRPVPLSLNQEEQERQR